LLKNSLYIIKPFFTNKEKELTKSPVFYFKDSGLKNYASGEFGNVNDFGFLFQNFVYINLYYLSKKNTIFLFIIGEQKTKLRLILF
jgi:predicted AAA+ superfamily ATPase